MFNNDSKVSKRDTINKKWITEEEFKKVFPRGYRECNFFSSPVEFWAMSKEACRDWRKTALIDLTLQKNLQQTSFIGHSSDTKLLTKLLNQNNKDSKTEARHKNTSINQNVNMTSDVLLKNISDIKNCYTCNNVCKCSGLLSNRLNNPLRKNNCDIDTVALLSKGELVFPEIQLIDNFDKFSIKSFSSLSNSILNNNNVSVTSIAKPRISQNCYMFENGSDSEREEIVYDNHIMLLTDTPNNPSIQSSSTSWSDNRAFVTERAVRQVIQDESTIIENNEYYENVLNYYKLNSISDIFQYL